MSHAVIALRGLGAAATITLVAGITPFALMKTADAVIKGYRRYVFI